MPERPYLVRLPTAWFWEPLREAMKASVRPPTALTRRRQLEVRREVSRQVFELLMAPLEEKHVVGLRREDDGLGRRLLPTRETPKLKYYEYVIQKGYVTDKLWRLEELYVAPKKGSAQYKRGLGAMRLNLTAAAARRGEAAQSASMVCGNVLVHFKV